MNPPNNKMKALSKDETKCLLDLVEKSHIINYKTPNKLKNDEWIRIAGVFNSTNSLYRRTPQQLRLKWENLKKNARKRRNKILMNRIKSRGEVPSYIPPDDILDQVLSLLESKVDGFEGDAESKDFDSGSGSTVNLTGIDKLENGNIENHSEVSTEEVVAENVEERVNITPYYPRKMSFAKLSGSKKTCKKVWDDGRRARNLAMAEFYMAKKKCLDANYETIVLENQKLKLEIEQLKSKFNLSEKLTHSSDK